MANIALILNLGTETYQNSVVKNIIFSRLIILPKFLVIRFQNFKGNKFHCDFSEKNYNPRESLTLYKELKLVKSFEFSINKINQFFNEYSYRI